MQLLVCCEWFPGCCYGDGEGIVWCSWSFYPITMWMNSRVLLGAVNVFSGVLVCCYGVKGGWQGVAMCFGC